MSPRTSQLGLAPSAGFLRLLLSPSPRRRFSLSPFLLFVPFRAQANKRLSFLDVCVCVCVCAGSKLGERCGRTKNVTSPSCARVSRVSTIRYRRHPKPPSSASLPLPRLRAGLDSKLYKEQKGCERAKIYDLTRVLFFLTFPGANAEKRIGEARTERAAQPTSELASAALTPLCSPSQLTTGNRSGRNIEKLPSDITRTNSTINKGQTCGACLDCSCLHCSALTPTRPRRLCRRRRLRRPRSTHRRPRPLGDVHRRRESRRRRSYNVPGDGAPHRLRRRRRESLSGGRPNFPAPAFRPRIRPC